MCCRRLPTRATRRAACGLRYAPVTVEQAVGVIRGLPVAIQETVRSVPAEARSIRPESDQWSVTEYGCHLRDVYVTYTIRLHRARTEDRPVLEPMLNDLRVRRFGYNERDVDAVLDGLAATIVVGFCDEVARNRQVQWSRLVTRLPGEVRTARWLVKQAKHKGRHHLDDIRGTAAAVATVPDPSSG